MFINGILLKKMKLEEFEVSSNNGGDKEHDEGMDGAGDADAGPD